MAKTRIASQAEGIKLLLLRNGEAINKHDLAAVADTLVQDLEVVGPDGTYRGRDRFLAEVAKLFEAFPDYGIVLDELIVEGNKAAYVARLEGAARCRQPGNESPCKW